MDVDFERDGVLRVHAEMCGELESELTFGFVARLELEAASRKGVHHVNRHITAIITVIVGIVADKPQVFEVRELEVAARRDLIGRKVSVRQTLRQRGRNGDKVAGALDFPVVQPLELFGVLGTIPLCCVRLAIPHSPLFSEVQTISSSAFAEPCASGRLPLRHFWLVVERSPVRGFVADCLILKLFKPFPFTLISSFRFGIEALKVSQQFTRFYINHCVNRCPPQNR